MQLKTFVVPLKNVSGAEQDLNSFLRSHRVLAVRKEFVSDGENSFWAFCVEYLDSPGALSAGPLGGKLPKTDYKEILSTEEFAVFSRLRDYRKTVAEKEGIPVYSVLTNEQLARMVQRKVRTLADLKDIEGVGEARVAKYGEALIGLLTNVPPS